MFIKIPAVVISTVFFFLLVNAHENYHLSPSTIYARTLLGQTRRLAGVDEAHNLLLRTAENIWPLSEIIKKRTHFSSSFLEKIVTQSDRDCLVDMAAILFATFPGKKSWAFKYLDAWAKPPAGIMKGDFVWYGDFDECLAIEPVEIVPDRLLKPQYCHIGLSQVSQSPSFLSNMTKEKGLMQANRALMIGLCVSTACNEETLSLVISDLLPQTFGIRVDPAATYCQRNNPPLTAYTYIAIGSCSVLGLVIFVGLFFDVIIRLRNSARRRHADIEPLIDSTLAPAMMDPSQVNGNGQGAGIERPPVGKIQNQQEEQPPHVKTANPGPRLGKLGRVLLCFSPYSNFAKLFTLPSASNSAANVPNFSALHSIRALSLLWVLLGHCYLFMFALNFGAVNNLFVMIDWPKQFTFQFVLAAMFAVDTFFFLSGFFAYWSISRAAEKAINEPEKGGRFWFWKSLPFMYLHRYLRITPPYLAIIMVDVCLWAHLGNGPFYFQDFDMICMKNWWTNALFVNNFLSMQNSCIGWAWYLAIDMQLFVFIAPFLVALFVWRPFIGWIASLLAILAQAAYAAPMTYIKNLPSTPFPPLTGNETLELSSELLRSTMDYFEFIYIKSYSRLGAYVAGIVTCHIVVKHSSFMTRKLFSRPILSTFLWLLWTASMFALIYGQYGLNNGEYVNPKFVDAFYNAFARTAWGIAIGWLVLALAFNRAGPIGRALSWPLWALPAKLSYSAYLVQPLILIYFVQTSRRSFHATDLTMTFFFCGSTVATFIVATLFSLAIESPIIGLQRLMNSGASANAF